MKSLCSFISSSGLRLPLRHAQCAVGVWAHPGCLHCGNGSLNGVKSTVGYASLAVGVWADPGLSHRNDWFGNWCVYWFGSWYKNSCSSGFSLGDAKCAVWVRALPASGLFDSPLGNADSAVRVWALPGS